MPKDTSIVLGGRFAEFIDRQVEDGLYGSPADVVQAGLRLLEERETRLAALRAALIAGEDSGPATAFDLDAYVARKLADASADE